MKGKRKAGVAEEHLKVKRVWGAVATAVATCLTLIGWTAYSAAQIALSQVPVPEPRNLSNFVADRDAAIRLGKALFWDMQVGSDGLTACASCHFNAGADNRTRNTMHAGPAGVLSGGLRPNDVIGGNDFPFVRFAVPDNRNTARTVREDIVGSQGVTRSRLTGVVPGRAVERAVFVHDPSFSRNGRNVRQATRRNAPSVINSIFNFSNVWDGRANHFFNGVNQFGVMDANARVYLHSGALEAISLTSNLSENPFALDNASVASQATGPPMSSTEMSWAGRTWPDVGRKMLPLRPLAGQSVHAQDSRLAAVRHSSGKGLNTTYDAMVRAAFRPEFWNSSTSVNGFSQSEQNFSLFFGLSVQLYLATLVSDQTPFDRWLLGDDTALSPSADRGRSIFFSGGASCNRCHIGPELTSASVGQVRAPGEAGLIELMSMGDGALANYDIGFYNIAVAPTSSDPGRGGTAPVRMADGREMPLSFARQYFEGAPNLGFMPLAQPGCVNDFLADPPTICPPVNVTVTRVAVNGAFKTPGLRNVALTGPYMHNGSMATLRQVVDFYARGGNFHNENLADLDPFIDTIGQIQGSEQAKTDLVNFLLALTDERVRQESAPFDHPELLVPNRHRTRIDANPKRTRVLADDMRVIPAVGAAGRAAQGLSPIRPFMTEGLSQEAADDFHYQP